MLLAFHDRWRWRQLACDAAQVAGWTRTQEMHPLEHLPRQNKTLHHFPMSQ